MYLPENIRGCTEELNKLTGSSCEIYMDSDYVALVGSVSGAKLAQVREVCLHYQVSWSVSPPICMGELFMKGMVKYNE